jgi:probable phosphoglycerate mutase
MAEAPERAVTSRFLHALDRLHERFLVGDPEVTEIWLVRHGDAYAELVSLDDAKIDPPLSAKGRAEAEKLGLRLAQSGVSAMWASPIRRAQETAEIAARAAGLTIHTDPRLREVKTRWENGAEPPPEGSDSGYIPFVEPLEEVVERMDGAVQDIAVAAGPGARVAAVTHAGAISMYLLHVLKLDSGPLRVLPLFTSVSVLLVKGDRMVVQSIGDVGHLAREKPGG